MSVKAVLRSVGRTDGVSAARSVRSARENAPTLEPSSPIAAAAIYSNNYPESGETRYQFANHVASKYGLK